MWPRTFEASQYSTAGQVVAILLVIAGLCLAFLSRRHPRHVVFTTILVALGAIAIAVNSAAAVTLYRDPHRSLGRVPLPEPWATLGALLGLFLAYFSPIAGAFLVGRAATRTFVISARTRLAAVVVAAYAIYVSPWALDVLLD